MIVDERFKGQIAMGIMELLKKRTIICDGAIGTEIYKRGIKAGPCLELINHTNPETVESIYDQYFMAGSDFVATNTFGTNRHKLKKIQYSVDEVIEQAVKIARTSANKAEKLLNKKKYVALDIAPIGKKLDLAKNSILEEVSAMFKEQAVAGAKYGADFILLETFMDIDELRIAIVSVRDVVDLPIFATVTFNKEGKMLNNINPINVIDMLNDLGVEAMGVNCSLDVKGSMPIIDEFLKRSKVPVIFQPSMGLPRMVNGKAEYDTSEEEYISDILELVERGLSVVGGCCGTTPSYIKKLKDVLK